MCGARGFNTGGGRSRCSCAIFRLRGLIGGVFHWALCGQKNLARSQGQTGRGHVDESIFCGGPVSMGSRRSYMMLIVFTRGATSPMLAPKDAVSHVDQAEVSYGQPQYRLDVPICRRLKRTWIGMLASRHKNGNRSSSCFSCDRPWVVTRLGNRQTRLCGSEMSLLDCRGRMHSVKRPEQ